MPEFMREPDPAGVAKRRRVRTVAVLLVLGAAAVAVLVLYTMTACWWVGGFQVRVVVTRNGKPVPAQEIGAVQYLMFHDQKQCSEMLELISNGIDLETRPAMFAEGCYRINVETYGTESFFGLFRTYNQDHGALVKVTMADGRSTHLVAASIANRDRNQTITVAAPQAQDSGGR